MSYTKTGNPVELLHVVKNCITSLILQGKTNQPGTGDPSPTNIRPISGVGEYRSNGYYTDIVVTTNGVPKTYTIGPMSAPLYDGDSLDFVSGIVNRKRGCLSLDGTNGGLSVISNTNGLLRIMLSDITMAKNLDDTSENIMASHYKHGNTLNCIKKGAGNEHPFIWVSLTDYPNLNAYKAYLSAQYAAGTPVTIVYELATPTTETVPISEPLTNAAGTVTLSAENTLQVTVGVMSEEVSPPTPLSEPMVNGKLFSAYGGAMLLDYTVGGTEITNDYFRGRNRSSWNQLSTVFGMRPVKLSIVFTGSDLNRVTLQKSQFDAACFGQIELFLPDGFFYTANTVSVGDSSIVGIGETQAIIKADYSFEGIRHSPMVTATLPAGGGTVYCQSTLPFTDCILSCTVTAPAASYVLGGATFKNVQAGETLVFDGINKRILRGGAPGANNVNWTVFPQLIPGANNLTCVDAVIVQYYPVYM